MIMMREGRNKSMVEWFNLALLLLETMLFLRLNCNLVKGGREVKTCQQRCV